MGYSVRPAQPGEVIMTQMDDPKIGTLWRVDTPHWGSGKEAIDEIGVDFDRNSLSIGSAWNKYEDGNPTKLSMSELAMNVWRDAGGGNPSKVETVYVQSVIEITTSDVLKRAVAYRNSGTWELGADHPDTELQTIFRELTTDLTAFGGAVDKMNRNWIGKSVIKVEVEGSDCITYHLA